MDYSFAVTVRPDRTYSVSEITTNSRRFLAEVYELIGGGCDFVEPVNCGNGLYMLVDGEPFRRNPEPDTNRPLHVLMHELGYQMGQAIQGAVVFVGETSDGEDLAGLSSAQVAPLRAALSRITTTEQSNPPEQG